MPFSTHEKRVSRQYYRGRTQQPYPAHPQTLGQHVIKARIDRGLTIEEVAAYIKTARQVVNAWERNVAFPNVRTLKRVIEFLGYYPFPEPKTLGEKLKKYRRMNGLRIQELAKVLCTAPQELRELERGESPRKKGLLHKVKAFIKSKELSD